MKKFLVFLFSALFIAANAAPVQSKMPASASAAVALNSEQLLNWPLFQQMAGPQLQAELAKEQLTIQDIQGSIAVGVTFAKAQPKENYRIDVIVSLKQPVAAKLFAVVEKKLAQVPDIVRSNEKGKKCISTDKFKIVLVNQNELTCQLRNGNKLKFVKLTKNKNIFNKVKLTGGTVTIALDMNKIGKTFAEVIPEQFKSMLDNKLLSGASIDLRPDGSLKYQSLDTFKTAAACKAAVELTNTQLAQLKTANPALAAVIDNLKIETAPTSVRTSSELSATDVQMVTTSAMMMVMAQAQKAAAPAAPIAPATPVK